jgi:type I restriction enzyme, S subunit
MSHYTPYPAYKDSGVEWIGRVPEHWEVKRFKFAISNCRNGIWGDDPTGHDDTPCVRVADFDRSALRVNQEIPTLRAIPERDRASRLLRPGNLLLEKSGGGDSQPVGQVVLYDQAVEAVCSNFIARMELVHRADPSFWRYEFAAAYACGLNRRSVKQTSGIQNLDQEQYLDEMATYPPPAEQSAIAAALDRETARIDALIARKTRFIELLQEKRQALITHAVTKGLDPSVKMKDSGVAWIGQVPEHWELAQLGKLSVSRCDGPFGSGLKSEHYTDSGVRVIRLQNIGWAQFKDSDAAYIAFDYWQGELGGGHDALPGDVLIAGLGDENNLLGRACVVPDDTGKAMVKADCYRFRVGPRVVPEYVALTLSATSRAECGFLATGATRDRLNLTLASARRIPVPPVQEQREIVTAIHHSAKRLDELMAKVECSITLLKERRSALITAAVTGQIDLREEAA